MSLKPTKMLLRPDQKDATCFIYWQTAISTRSTTTHIFVFNLTQTDKQKSPKGVTSVCTLVEKMWCVEFLKSLSKHLYRCGYICASAATQPFNVFMWLVLLVGCCSPLSPPWNEKRMDGKKLHVKVDRVPEHTN